MVPHFAIHGRGHHDGTSCGHEQRAQQIIRQAQRTFGQAVRRRRGHQDQVRLFSRSQVRQGLGIGKEPLKNRPSGQHFEGQRRHELRGGRRQDHGHLRPFLDKRPKQRHGFIGRNAARDTEDDPFAL